MTYQGVFNAHPSRCYGWDRSESTQVQVFMYIEDWSSVINKYSLRVAPPQLGWPIHVTYLGMVDCNNR